MNARTLKTVLPVVGLIASLTLPAIAEPAPAPPAPSAPVAAPAAPRIENSVVHIFSTVRRPEITKPWTKASPTEVSGSGVVIEGHRILTNAHVILYASQIQVQGDQSGDKYSASVEYFNPYIDLALLKMEDESFFATHPPIRRSSQLPSLKDTVMAYGFPTGGTNLSITKGIVSRIEFTHYNYPVSGLRIQIDAAINPGNSGGPAVAGDQMIGLAFSHLGNAQNIGYIIPNEEIALFLADVADGKVDGKPGYYDTCQHNENPALRKYLRLPEGAEGVLISELDVPDPGYPLQVWDLITRIGQVKVNNEGMIQIAPGLTVSFGYEIQHVAHDGKLPLTIIRAGKTLEVEVPVHNSRAALIPNRVGEYPRYFILGPLVFTAADSITTSWIGAGNNGAILSRLLATAANPLLTRHGDHPAFPGEELVFVTSPFFPHKLAQGYNNPFGHVVAEINGNKVKNLQHLVELLRDAKDEYVVFGFAGRNNETLVFARAELLKATDEILSDGGVRSQGSPELMEVWHAKATASQGR